MTSGGDNERAAREHLARHAAREMFLDPTADVEEALRRVPRGRLGAFAGVRTGRGLVYRHLQAMLEEAHGQVGFQAGRRRRLQSIVELLDLVDYACGPDAIDVAGRTAQGFLEGPLLVFARLYGGSSLEPLAGELEANGVQEVAFATARTRLGRLPRLLVVSDGIRFSLTRCPRAAYGERERNLFSGAPIVVVSLEELRARAGA